MRLVFSAHPSETALFTRERISKKKKNVTTFFESLSGKVILEVTLAEGDRLVTIDFTGGDQLLFQVYGNHPNVFHVHDGVILASFKGGAAHQGKPAPVPRIRRPQRGQEKTSSGEQSTEHSERRSANLTAELPVEPTARKKMLGIAPSFPREHINPLIQQHNLQHASVDEIQHKMMAWMRQMEESPVFRVLENGYLCLLPEEELSVLSLDVFESCDDAVRFCFDRTSSRRRLRKKLESMEGRIETEQRKISSKIGHIEDPEKTLARAARYEEFGHLLMARAHEILPPGADYMEVNDFYHGGSPVKIPVKSRRTVVENAEAYYGKAHARRERLEAMKMQSQDLKKKMNVLKFLADSLSEVETHAHFEAWLKKNREWIAMMLPAGKGNGVDEKGKPWRVLQLDGYEVWIGKNAKSNDILLAEADKEDIWMHARGVSGSHLILRMNRAKELPPATVISRAAAMAAWYSKARGASIVPVIHTRRKYVVKPKGAPAGAVRVMRETVELVTPKKPSDGQMTSNRS